VEPDYRNVEWECGLDSAWSRQVPVASACEPGNKPSDSVKDWQYL
jgi:hypothetical protein